MKKLITNKQIRCIKTVQRKHQADDDYREMLEKRFKVTSCTQLTCDQATALIRLYVKWGWTNFPPVGVHRTSRPKKRWAGRGRMSDAGCRMPDVVDQKKDEHRTSNIERPTSNEKKKKKPVPRQAGNMTQMVSPAQMKKIGALANMIEWRVKDGLTRWVSKRFSTDRIRTAQQAWQVIEGLKKMFEHQMKKQYGPGWRDLDYDDGRIRRYIEG